ncbi:glycosyl hydrolase family 18 protein [Sutcliffiella halmapala]|uniref:glycosyl hydrolase family 18 protein n=1 Tax=Sutcliffiella halmapala TaxID=79882 RepID=UPI000995B1B4|nr:glycosyl hydrolase family 18 protein [Sutcliffiella halmapala]
MQRRRNKKKLIVFSLVMISIIGLLTYWLVRNDDNNIASPTTSKEDTKEIPPVDQPPEISEIMISSIESEGSSVSGDVSLSVEVKDDNEITKVEFYSSDGDYLIGEVKEEPYTINWATDPWVPDGEQVLKVVVYDSSNQTTEVSQKVLVNNLQNKAQHDFKLVGYYAGWATYSGYNVKDIDASKLTHLNYAFANISADGKLEVGDLWADVDNPFSGDSDSQVVKGNFYQLQKLKEEHPHLKTLISVGGWTWSDKFSDVALTEESRAIFAESVRQFLLNYGFDGVDLDWEYPVSGGAPGNKNRPEDKQNYTLLLKKIRETLDAQSKKDGKEYLLTIAAGASKNHAANMELGILHQYVDYVQLMTYDIHGEWDTLSGFNAPLHEDPTSGFESEWSVQDGVETFIKSGVPGDKLVMGLPFYGRAFKQVDNENNGLYQSFSGGGSSLTYAKIDADYIEKNGFTRSWDETTKVPFLFDGTTFISYDDVESIGYKTAFIQEMGLGGAMMWELSQDPDEVLLTKIYQELKK